MADQLGLRIRLARTAAGLTQEQMAPKIGVTLRTLSRYESGETQSISVRTMNEIAKATGKPLSYFVTDEVAA